MSPDIQGETPEQPVELRNPFDQSDILWFVNEQIRRFFPHLTGRTEVQGTVKLIEDGEERETRRVTDYRRPLRLPEITLNQNYGWLVISLESDFWPEDSLAEEFDRKELLRVVRQIKMALRSEFERLGVNKIVTSSNCELRPCTSGKFTGWVMAYRNIAVI